MFRENKVVEWSKLAAEKCVTSTVHFMISFPTKFFELEVSIKSYEFKPFLARWS